MTMFINEKSEYNNVEFDFKVIVNGAQDKLYGYYNGYSIEGGVKDQIRKISEYMEKAYPTRSFTTIFKDENGLCCESTDGQVKAYIPVWDDAKYDVVYKV